LSQEPNKNLKGTTAAGAMSQYETLGVAKNNNLPTFMDDSKSIVGKINHQDSNR
jgi:hypothetical protein